MWSMSLELNVQEKSEHTMYVRVAQISRSGDFCADNDRQQTKLIILPLAHACGIINGSYNMYMHGLLEVGSSR